jgi:predicted DNA-binding protein
MKDKNQQCNLYLPASTVAMLDRVAAATGKPRSTLANEVLRNYLEPTVIALFLGQPVHSAQQPAQTDGVGDA